MSTSINSAALLVAALRNMGCSARMIDERIAEIEFDELEIVPKPGEMELRYFASGKHIYTMSVPWRAGQTVRLTGVRIRTNMTESQ